MLDQSSLNTSSGLPKECWWGRGGSGISAVSAPLFMDLLCPAGKCGQLPGHTLGCKFRAEKCVRIVGRLLELHLPSFEVAD